MGDKYIGGNKFTELPFEICQLSKLKTLDLDDNPLNPALQSAYDACQEGSYEGYAPLWAYLISLELNAEPLYEAKLVLVGEGNVGKTTLLKALKGTTENAPRQGEPTTHGVEIDRHALRLAHPDKDGVEVQLNAWDFGGQDVYRVTHQFFFSKRSLYLLVWEPRNNVQQGRLDEWLDMIRLRVGDEARVIIISTHCKSGGHLARIDKADFQRRYGDMIVGFHEVDSLVLDETSGEMTGIAELKKLIAAAAAKLPQMGMGFNLAWKAARDELLDLPEPRIAYSAFCQTCAAHGLSEIDADTLAHLMHDLGYIVHYADDENLREDVVLKPEWLTKAIGFVLENRATAEREGLLPDDQLYQVWHEHGFAGEPRYTSELYPFFLRLMEKYDVCYRLLDGKASLVAQHVPQVRPELPWFPEDDAPAKLRRIAMICAMEEDPPGLVPWMIVRTHDYAVNQNSHRLHWQKGMFLRHGAHGEAMLEKRDREFHLYAQAAWPEHFMNVLHSTLEKLITDNWPGLVGRYRFAVPCPEIIGNQACKGRFNIHALREFLTDGDSTIRCQECSKKQSITELLMGFEERDTSAQLREIQEQVAQARAQLAGMDSRIADYFMATMNAIANEAKRGPRLFTLREHKVSLLKTDIFKRPLELQLWCEAEGCQHPVTDEGLGVYTVEQSREWLAAVAPYASFALKLLKTVAPIAAPAINTFFDGKATETWGIDKHLELAKEIVDKLPEGIKIAEHGDLQRDRLSAAERSGILALHRFLKDIDPTQAKLGLHRVATYTGDYRWLCKQHYDAQQPSIPDQILPD
ncbi:COR domain-containing protein [Methylomonas fluvii]|uniref:COR domain-containing protein n=1 Tax=Methylomonas fluvii TaxID=1854564 RepID=UPI001CE09E1F|nr:COR domain-containing protein [Methylomonas fluvii]